MSDFNDKVVPALSEDFVKHFIMPSNLGPNNPELTKGKSYMKRTLPKRTANGNSTGLQNDGFYLYDWLVAALVAISNDPTSPVSFGDDDWYTESTIDVPSAITDNIYHTGYVGVGHTQANPITHNFHVLGDMNVYDVDADTLVYNGTISGSNTYIAPFDFTGPAITLQQYLFERGGEVVQYNSLYMFNFDGTAFTGSGAFSPFIGLEQRAIADPYVGFTYNNKINLVNGGILLRSENEDFGNYSSTQVTAAGTLFGHTGTLGQNNSISLGVLGVEVQSSDNFFTGVGTAVFSYNGNQLVTASIIGDTAEFVQTPGGQTNMSALNGATFAESTFGLSSFAILASFNNAAGTISGLALDSFGSAFTATSDSGLTISQIQALVNRGDGDPGIYLFGVPEHADNAAALLAGLFTGVIYRTGDTLKIVH